MYRWNALNLFRLRRRVWFFLCYGVEGPSRSVVGPTGWTVYLYPVSSRGDRSSKILPVSDVSSNVESWLNRGDETKCRPSLQVNQTHSPFGLNFVPSRHQYWRWRPWFVCTNLGQIEAFPGQLEPVKWMNLKDPEAKREGFHRFYYSSRRTRITFPIN